MSTMFRHEYVSAFVAMGPIASGQVWELTVWIANRGETTESFQVQFLGRLPQSDPEFQSIWSPEVAVAPLQAQGSGLGLETDPDFMAFEGWWARILTTSANLVPTLRFNVENTQNPPVPEFFFGPGDFAVFPVRPILPIPPIVIGPGQTA
jgi:hypothetical protein